MQNVILFCVNVCILAGRNIKIVIFCALSFKNDFSVLITVITLRAMKRTSGGILHNMNTMSENIINFYPLYYEIPFDIYVDFEYVVNFNCIFGLTEPMSSALQ